VKSKKYTQEKTKKKMVNEKLHTLHEEVKIKKKLQSMESEA